MSEEYQSYMNNQFKKYRKYLLYAIVSSGAMTLTYAFLNYRVCNANQWLIRTGLGIKNKQLKRSCVRWPLQYLTTIDMSPLVLKIDIEGPTKDLIPTCIPFSITLRPIDPEKDPEGFNEYVSRVANLFETKNQDDRKMRINELIAPFVTGAGRQLVATMEIQELFVGREDFKKQVEEIMTKEVNKYGMEIQNACIQNLQDTEGNEYFNKLKAKALKGADAKSEQDVARAEKDKQVGISEAHREQEINVQQNRTEQSIKVAESQKSLDIGVAMQLKEKIMGVNLSNVEIIHSNAKLAIETAEAKLTSDIAELNADMMVKKARAEQEREMYKLIAQQELERIRSTELMKAQVDAECIQLKADAELYASQQRAKGYQAENEAKSKYINNLLTATNDNELLTGHVLALENGTYVKLAEQQAEGIKGLEPKFNIIAGSGTEAIDPLIKTLAVFGGPVLQTLQQFIPSNLNNMKQNQ